MGGVRALPVDEILARGTLAEADVTAFRGAFYADGIVDAAEADLIFNLNRQIAHKPESWNEFFVEALTDFVVYQHQPAGYLTSGNADWLIERMSTNGHIDTRLEIELLVAIMEKARWSPVSLVTFALQQVKYAVVSGKGPLRTKAQLAAGEIADADVDLVRRMMYGFGGDGNVAITRNEADVLFDIDDSIADDKLSAAWTDLFVKAIANVMMAASGYRVPSREEALRQEAVLQHPGQQTSVLAFLISMVQTNMETLRDAYLDQTPEERALARLEHQRIEIITNEKIDEAEAAWLVSRLGRDGRLSTGEKALVAYLKHESPKIHPILTDAVARLGSAA